MYPRGRRWNYIANADSVSPLLILVSRYYHTLHEKPRERGLFMFSLPKIIVTALYLKPLQTLSSSKDGLTLLHSKDTGTRKTRLRTK